MDGAAAVKVRHRKTALRSHVMLGGSLQLVSPGAPGAVLTEPFQLHVGLLVADPKDSDVFHLVGAGLLHGMRSLTHRRWRDLLIEGEGELRRRLLGFRPHHRKQGGDWIIW